MKFTVLALILGFIIDLIVGDPHSIPHPVVFIGKLISLLEKELRKRFPATVSGERAAGAVLWILVVLASFLVRILPDFYTAEELRAVPGEFTASPLVERVTGVDNVCERAALLGADTLIVKKQAAGGVTVALAAENTEVRFG